MSSTETSADAYAPALEAHKNAAAAHRNAVFSYGDKLWRRAEALANLDGRDVIVMKDIELTVRELEAKSGGYVPGVVGGVLLGAGLGAPLGWLPSLTAVEPWHWVLAVVAVLVGAFLLWVSRRVS